MTLHQRVRRFARDHNLWTPETRVVAAVSGGSDSVALLLLLHDLHGRGELVLDAVAHLNHGIRDDADKDESFCRALSDGVGIPFVSSRVDVPALARRRKQSIEIAARIARRRFLDEVRQSRDADRVATGHTQDDQAETVLLRLIRGAGPRGLSAIAPSRARLVRPVLCATRDELRDELRRRGQTWRDDSTNADLANPRNRVRHELLPYLARHFNPSIRDSLVRAAEVARSDEDQLAREAASATVLVLGNLGDSVRLDRRALAALPLAIARRVVLYTLSAFQPKTTGTLRHVDAVLDVVHERRAASEIPGLRVEHSREFVVLVRRPTFAKATVGKGQARPGVAPFRADLPIPGEISFPDAGVIVQALGPFPGPGAQALTTDVWRLTTGDWRLATGVWPLATGDRRLTTDEVCVAADELGSALVVRSRQPGDRLRPLGVGGRKKLQDVLVDRKVNRSERDRVPIVTDARGRIVWVAGHVIGQEFRVTDHTNAVLILKLRRISHAGIRPDPGSGS